MTETKFTTGWSRSQPYQIFSNCETYIELGFVSKDILKIEVVWYDEDGDCNIEAFKDLYKAYTLCFQLVVFDKLEIGSSVELTVIFKND